MINFKKINIILSESFWFLLIFSKVLLIIMGILFLILIFIRVLVINPNIVKSYQNGQKEASQIKLQLYKKSIKKD